MNEKTIQCLPNPSQHLPIHLQQFPSYSNRKCKKLPFSRTAAHIFVSPGDAPAIITQYVVWMERQLNACQTPRSIYLSIFNSFRVIRCLNQCISPKIAIFTTFLFSRGDAPGAITLNVVWTEREFDAYKLSRWMCPSKYNRFSDRARYALAFNITTPFGAEKPEWCGYPWWKKFEDIFIRFGATHERDRQTDGRTDGHHMPTLVRMHRAVKNEIKFQVSSV